MRVVCWLAVLAGTMFGGLRAASAQSQAAIQACTPDAMRLCSEFIPDRAKVRDCMLRKVGEVSQACRSAMRGGRNIGARRVYYRPIYHRPAYHRPVYHRPVYHRPVRKIIHRRSDDRRPPPRP
jgi:hypothetical protein